MANAHAKDMADGILNAVKGTSLTLPGTLYVGLFSTTPTANTGSGTEITGSSYARQPITSAQWSGITQSADTIHDQISNTVAINFPTVTGSPYTVVGIGVWDASTAGNMKMYQAVTSQAVSVGNFYGVASGALVWEE